MPEIIETRDFGQTEKAPRPCAYQECENGHFWPLNVTLVGCNGCGGPTYATKAELCPECNSPFQNMVIRIDVTSPVMGIPRTCEGQFGKGLTAQLKISYEDWKDYQVLTYDSPKVRKAEDEENKNFLVDSGKEKEKLEKERKDVESVGSGKADSRRERVPSDKQAGILQPD